jgi:hypothetical protein
MLPYILSRGALWGKGMRIALLRLKNDVWTFRTESVYYRQHAIPTQRGNNA